MKKYVGIVIPVHNEFFYTKKFIHSLLLQIIPDNYKLVLVVVDNNSSDETKDFKVEEVSTKESFLENILLIRNKENLGFGPACNQAMDHLYDLYGDLLHGMLISNNDVELDKECLKNLIQCADLESSYGIVGGKLLFPDNTLQHCGAFLGPYGWGIHKGAGGPNDENLFNNIEEQEYVTGALFYIKTKTYEIVGKFDEEFKPAYFEETDFAYRARLYGLKTVYCPGARAIHYENVTGKNIYGNIQTLKKELSDKNQITFYKKRFEEYEEKCRNLSSSTDINPKILLNCKIYGNWSFSGVMRNLAKGLNRNGVDVSIAPEEYHEPVYMTDWEIKEMILKPNDYWNRVVLRSCEGEQMYMLPPGKKRIAHTTGENSIINPMWKIQLNNVDQVLTTSHFFKRVLENSGVTTKVEVLHNSVDIKKFNLKVSKYPLNDLRGFNFISSFYYGSRKGVDVLMKAFVTEFASNEDVTLTLQSPGIHFALQNAGKSLGDWVKMFSNYKRTAPIFILKETIDEQVLPRLFLNFDCAVCPSRAEGFGLVPLEMAALKIPSIVTGYSGFTEVVNVENGWLIDYKMIDIPLQILPYYQNYIGGEWAEPDVEHLRYLMRYVYEHPEEVKKKGEKAFEKAQEFSIEKIGKKAKELIFKDI